MVKIKPRNVLQTNIKLVGSLFMLVFFIIALRAYSLQILQSEELMRRIESQHKGRFSLAVRRGTIYDANAVELAVSIKVDSLCARPHLIDDPDETARQLADVLSLPEAGLLKTLNRQKHFVWIKRKLTPDEATGIRRLNSPGLELVKENKRYYPNRELAGQILGFAGVDTQGLEGVEYEYDDLLKGKRKDLTVSKDAMGRCLFVEGIRGEAAQTYGHDIILTIDKNIQYIAEKELQAAVSLSEARGGIAVIMDPWSGEILALANVPLFNPNHYQAYRPAVRRNRAVTDLFEPGSTFKPFLVAAALQENMIKPHDIFFCENGIYRIADKTIHDIHPHGWLDVTNIIKYSSNIGVSKISKHLGKDTFYQYIRKFGFAEETGIRFPIEAAGFVPLPYRCSEHTQSAMAFGQGISVTPLQLAAAYSALANGGLLMRPYIIRAVRNAAGEIVHETKPCVRRRVSSEQTARTVVKMLKSVVGEGGTGTKASIPGFSVAGKTGTSQKSQKKQRGYCNKTTIASFAGFVPADNPRITVLVIIDEPKRMAYGGEIAAPVFSRISQLILNYLHIVPDRVPDGSSKGWRAANRHSNKGIWDEA